MLSKDEVLQLITDLESDRLERTTSYREDKLGPAVCALANDFPNYKKSGYIFLGVQDDGTIAGMTIDDTILQSLGGLRSNGNILPQPPMIVSPVFTFPQGEVVVIEVLPSDLPPVRYKGVCWIRIGPRKAIAGSTEERMLSEKRVATARTFDEQPCKGSTLQDLNVPLFKINYLPQAIAPEILAENKRHLREQLASLRLYNLAYDCPTNAGILLLGIEPLIFIKGAYVQFVRFKGIEKSREEVDFEKQFSGALVNELKNINDFIQTNVIKLRPVVNGTFREDIVSNYPIWALRELVMNSMMHRDYESNAPVYLYEFEDRIEIQNPGGLYGDVNAQNFPNASDYRNPEIATAMKILGYVNRFNFGIRNAQTALRNNGNPEAEFDLTLGTKFQVTVRKSRKWK